LGLVEQGKSLALLFGKGQFDYAIGKS